jgi:type I restriction enzyme M protein
MDNINYRKTLNYSADYALYKFMNNIFIYEVQRIEGFFDTTEEKLNAMSNEEYDMVLSMLPPMVVRFNREHYLSSLYFSQDKEIFSAHFIDKLKSFESLNAELFTKSDSGVEGVYLFNDIFNYVTKNPNCDDFCRAIVKTLYKSSWICVQTEEDNA